MRKILALILILTLLLSFVGCQTSDNSDSTPTVTDSNKKPSQAMTVNDHSISDVELNYFYKDAINQWLNQYGNYASMFNLDLYSPLDQQVYDKESGKTWANYFTDLAVDNIKNDYALYDAAMAADFKLTDDQIEEIEDMFIEMEDYFLEEGYDGTEGYLREIYGESASLETYKDYYYTILTASAYYNHYQDDLFESYTDEDLAAFEGDKSYQYNSYSYATIYLPLENFKLGGTKGADGTITYSDEEIRAAEEYLKRVAQEIAGSGITTVEELNAAIAEIEDELAAAKETSAPTTYTTATENSQVLYSKITSLMQEWLRDANRVPGDITALPYENTTTDTNGAEIKTLRGYYVILFQQCHDNRFPLANVRHILAKFEGGTYNSTTGQTVYTDAEKKQAQTEADMLFQQWKDGEATEETFAEMANKHSDDGDGTTGGLYKDVYPGQMVTNFNNWCFDESRQPGDTGIVETEYGYHIMYYVGDSEQSFRNFMVGGDKLSADMEKWQTDLAESAAETIIDLSSIDSGYIILPQ